MPTSDDRDALIAQILGIHQDLGRLFAYDRSIPFLATTLTMQQLKVLSILSFQDNISGLELSHHLGAKLGTVTGIVDRLVQRDLVARREDPDDRRIRRVVLAPAGRELLDELTDTSLGMGRDLLEELDVSTLRQFAHVLDKVRTGAQRRHRAQNETARAPDDATSASGSAARSGR